MLHRTGFVGALVALAAVATVGCSGGRDVDVSGSVAAQAGLSVSGPITVNFLDVVNDTDPPKSAGSTTLEKPGDFEQKVSVSGDTVRVFALVDTNEDGKCTAGEPWAETNAPIGTDDKVDAVTLTLATGSCPTDVGD
jgi:hypothetical protein